MLIKKEIVLASFIYIWIPSAEIDAGDILQLFGKMFFEFCQESGYDTILRVLGSNVREFLQVKKQNQWEFEEGWDDMTVLLLWDLWVCVNKCEFSEFGCSARSPGHHLPRDEGSILPLHGRREGQQSNSSLLLRERRPAGHCDRHHQNRRSANPRHRDRDEG